MKKRRILVLLLVFTLLFSSFSSSAAKKSGTKNLTSTVKVKQSKGRKIKKREAKQLTSASIKLLDATIKNGKENENVFISPTSIMYAFGLAENGARGKTRSQIENVIYGGMKTKDTNLVMSRMMKNMESDKYVDWNIANSIWIKNQKDIKVKKSFLKNAKKYYDAEIYKAPFTPETVNDINKWVKKNTHKMIPKVINELSNDTVMCLINAIAFEGNWDEPFEKYQISENQVFTNIDGSTKKTTMYSDKESSYFELNGAKGFKKLYKGGKYAFVGIEMPENVKPADYISQLAAKPSAFNKALSNMKNDYDVSILMPKFSFDYNIEMSDLLKKNGVKNAFSKNKANLYNMFQKEPNSNYYFSNVIHKTHIEVDENGTKAAAVTAIVVEKCTSVVTKKPTMEIRLDHPFVYAIIDTNTNIPIFIGCANSL